MTRQQKTDDLIINDINMIIEAYSYGDTNFVDSVLRGEGWKPYNQLTNEELDNEYDEQFLNDDVIRNNKNE